MSVGVAMVMLSASFNLSQTYKLIKILSQTSATEGKVITPIDTVKQL